jgi:hypothetical protein
MDAKRYAQLMDTPGASKRHGGLTASVPTLSVLDPVCPLSYIRSLHDPTRRGSSEAYMSEGLNAVLTLHGSLAVADSESNAVHLVSTDNAPQHVLDGFDKPCCLAYDLSSDTLFVGDRHGVHTLRLSTYDRLATSERGMDGKRLEPCDLCYHDGKLLAATGEDGVLVLRASTLQPMVEIGLEPGPGELLCAWSVAAADDAIYVADSEADCVHVYGFDGEFRGTMPAELHEVDSPSPLFTSSLPSSTTSPFHTPPLLCQVDSVRIANNTVYVADHMRLQSFPHSEACAGEVSGQRLAQLDLKHHLHANHGQRHPGVHGLWVVGSSAWMVSVDAIHELRVTSV